MSVDRWPTACPECDSTVFEEIGRADADGGAFKEDVIIYSCANCGHEFDTSDVPGR